MAMTSRALCLAALLIGPWTGVRADEAASSALAVVRALPGGILELADGRVLRLAGIRMPAADGPGAALARQARGALAALVEHREVRIDAKSLSRDRRGRLVGQAWSDGLWLQGALLDQGLAQVQTRPGEVALAAEMAARERAARDAGLGIWAAADFAPRRADQVDQAGSFQIVAGSFQIVEGRVVRVAPTERFFYLNFGADWRTDFTLRVARGTARSFRQAGIDLEGLAGRQVEARGYVLEAGGPLIELSHPEQLRISR